MRYSIIAAALLSAVSAIPLTETLYSTEVKTITSCGPEVTDCPYKSKSTPAPVPVTTSCTEGHKQESWTAPPVYHSTTSAVVPPVTSEAPKPPKSYPAPPPEKETSKPAVPSSEAPKKSDYPPAPPPPAKSDVPPPPPPPASKSEAPVPPPSSKVVVTTVKPSVSSGTGIVPYKTSSASWAATSAVKYTGAASHLNAAGFAAGAGLLGALLF